MRTIPNIAACQNPVKENPGVKLLANIKNRTFKTKWNNPSVKKLIGQVKNFIIGFTIKFIIVNINVKTKIAVQPEYPTPTNFADIKTDKKLKIK